MQSSTAASGDISRTRRGTRQVALGWPGPVLGKVTHFSPKPYGGPEAASGTVLWCPTGFNYSWLIHKQRAWRAHPLAWDAQTQRCFHLGDGRMMSLQAVLRVPTRESGHTGELFLGKRIPKPTLALPVRSVARAAAPI